MCIAIMSATWCAIAIETRAERCMTRVLVARAEKLPLAIGRRNVHLQAW